jgi:hypothetical protein
MTTASLVVSVKDATTTSGLSGATVKWQTASLSGMGTTTSTGVVTLDGVPLTNVSVTAELDGYVTAPPVFVDPAETSHEVSCILSPVMSAKGWRVVLSWGAQPLDVDLHVFWGSVGNPYMHHVFYGDHGTSQVYLDVDDRVSYGPETVTVTDWPGCRVNNLECKLLIQVINYSKNPQMKDAKIEIYNGDTLKQQFQMDDGKALNPHDQQMLSIGLDWWVAALRADGTIEPCHPINGCV